MWKQKEYNKDKETKLLNNGTHRMLSRLIAQRDIPECNINDFIEADYQNLSHPHSIHGIEKAVQIFLENEKDGGKVAICGDYDVDGIVSSTMLKEVCNVFNLECEVFLPSRFEHGYGLSFQTVEDMMNRFRHIPDLLIVTDCGMNNKKEIEQLRENGVQKIIVIDHHMADEENISRNADALVSWRLSEGCDEMCACGEVFQFIRGIRWQTKKIDPIEFLSYAAIGTVADVMPIVGDNRIMVKNGLTEFAINHVMGIGLNALLQKCKIHPSSLTQEDIAFRVAPRMNAVGRMYDPDLVYQLLVERNVDFAKKLTEIIEEYNVKRKKEQKALEKDAKRMVEDNNCEHGILVFKENWNTGIVGIVASRLAEEYNKPSIVMGKLKGQWKGSGRTVGEINIKKVLDTCSNMFEKYGGHAGAVGLTLKEDFLKNASKIFDDACKKYIEENHPQIDSCNLFDAKLKPHAITPKVCDVINKLAPFCKSHNPAPLFCLTGATIVDVNYIEKETWRLLKFKVEKDGFQIPYEFKMFSPPCGSEIQDRRANIIFKFPQKTKDPSNRFFKFELDMVDLKFV